MEDGIEECLLVDIREDYPYIPILSGKRYGLRSSVDVIDLACILLKKRIDHALDCPCRERFLCPFRHIYGESAAVIRKEEPSLSFVYGLYISIYEI